KRDYCVVGAGPSGLQMAYFLQQAKRDYVVFERSNISGHFFSVYPKHRTLISINKRNTGQQNPDFNLRFDWNSLLSHDPSLLFKHFSRDYFPKVRILRSTSKFAATIMTRTTTTATTTTTTSGSNRWEESLTTTITMKKLRGPRTQRKSAGASVTTTTVGTILNPTTITTTIRKMLNPTTITITTPINPNRTTTTITFQKTKILTATRAEIRLCATATTIQPRPYKTKSYNYNYNNPDETKSNNYNNPDKTKSYNYNYNNPDETKSYNYNYNDGGQKNETSDSSTNEDGEHREEYDAIIRCLGFGYDDSMFSPSTMPRRWEGPKKRYPLINADYESANVPGMYFVGSTVHSLDYREASGGFIHGFRYTTRVLHRLLEFKHEGVPWPSTRGPLVDLVSAVMKTINEASGIYQMHHFLAEVFIINRKSMEFRHVPEYPLSLLKELAAKTGHEGTELMVLAMRLNPDFSGPRKDTFHENRATSDVDKAHLSNFLHPVVYYYDDISQAKVDPTNERNLVLPEPTKTHHVVEDFLIRWTSEHLHIAPLRKFVQSCLEVDLQRYRPADCLEKLMLKNESSP
ncbi:monooxygenase, putative, partial [Ixodes scapularis]